MRSPFNSAWFDATVLGSPPVRRLACAGLLLGLCSAATGQSPGAGPTSRPAGAGLPLTSWEGPAGAGAWEAEAGKADAVGVEQTPRATDGERALVVDLKPDWNAAARFEARGWAEALRTAAVADVQLAVDVVAPADALPAGWLKVGFAFRVGSEWAQTAEREVRPDGQPHALRFPLDLDALRNLGADPESLVLFLVTNTGKEGEPGAIYLDNLRLVAADAPEGGPAPAARAGPPPVRFAVELGAPRHAISDLIYGTNERLPGFADGWTLWRLGGNRLTGYNWENNASNAGHDWKHFSDGYLTWGHGEKDAAGNGFETDEPAFVPKAVYRNAKAHDAYTLVTVPMAGFVAADKRGAVAPDEVAPSGRWVQVVAFKPPSAGPWAAEPDAGDGAVYVDEFVHHLVRAFGTAGGGGVDGYSLDNEPALWPEGHPRIHPDQTTVAEIIEKSVATAKAIKSADPTAEVFGPALYGFQAINTFHDAPDWKEVEQSGGYGWFADAYLERMRRASDAAGVRLLDVFDVHYYPESELIDNGGARAIMDAPRLLWDETYRDNPSWITEVYPNQLPILPHLRESIERYYPGTKLAVTEYNPRMEDRVYGGIAMADYLGVFGREGVYAASYWRLVGDDPEATRYTAAALKLYRDFDSAGGRFGDTSVPARTSDPAHTSVYASLDAGGRLHLIAANKMFHRTLDVAASLGDAESYRAVAAVGFDGSSADLTDRPPALVEPGGLRLTLPPLSVTHYVLEPAGE